jgi:hypothetical protein
MCNILILDHNTITSGIRLYLKISYLMKPHIHVVCELASNIIRSFAADYLLHIYMRISTFFRSIGSFSQLLQLILLSARRSRSLKIFPQENMSPNTFRLAVCLLSIQLLRAKNLTLRHLLYPLTTALH